MIAIVALSVGNVGCQENYRLRVSLPETWGGNRRISCEGEALIGQKKKSAGGAGRRKGLEAIRIPVFYAYVHGEIGRLVIIHRDLAWPF
jgi:hypothetical protein